jgi:hypothetical protein
MTESRHSGSGAQDAAHATPSPHQNRNVGYEAIVYERNLPRWLEMLFERRFIAAT